jgi:hypothetical protein
MWLGLGIRASGTARLLCGGRRTQASTQFDAAFEIRRHPKDGWQCPDVTFHPV